MQRRHIQSHTALRGIAALLVVLYHLQFGADFRFSWEQSTPFFTKGYLWVDLFFILSGFVIAYSTQAETRHTFPWPEVKRFWRARFARIYPLHLFCLLLMAGIQTSILTLSSMAGKDYGDPDLWRGDSLLNFVEQLFLLNAWGLTGRIGWNIPSWSISAEAFAYLLFPALALFLARGGKYCVAALLAGSAAFYAYVALTSGNLDIVKGLAIARCLAGFSLGMILYWQRSAFDHLSSGTLGLLQLIGLALISAPLIAGLNDVIAIPGFFLLVAATWPDRGALPRLLARPFFQWLGEISYSIYLTHVVLLGPWRLIVPPITERLHIGDAMARVILIGGGVPMILLASTLTFVFIEQPARAALNRKSAHSS
ncbi:peptidoglycan/LPS O-acetylase OafA/YrhL [Sphingobium sp. B11D3B]|uniref:acyltransferase family protein n=1 Tax=Sphingobium sp. B11D3B TaxID=2940575 RepID=UPI002225D660|nr:acyltransferase [Sphingobium sp. B11D3B]MCW2390187.1 peptidoglycan/LPS O-acetylase OafA/YrhL [Sphingobium sp. B11D3B]